MAQRAILINGARDWNGTNTGLHGWTAPQTGWRPEVGWGELDLTTALAHRGHYALGDDPEGEASFYRTTVATGAKATLAFQMRGFFVSYPGPPFPAEMLKYTQSNLDLHQYRADGSEVAPPPAFDPPDTEIDPGPDAIDPNDTVEQVRAPAGGTQEITYKVQSASMIDGANAEPFAIAAAGPLTHLESPAVRPASSQVSPPGDVKCLAPVTISTGLENPSDDLDAEGALVGIDLPPGVELVSGETLEPVSGGTLGAGETSEVHSWTVRATTNGNKTIDLVGVGEAYDTQFVRQDSVVLHADCIAPETRIDAAPAPMTSKRDARFEFSSQGGGQTYECSLDAGAYAPCTSPFVATGLADGLHSFSVRASDAAGNQDASAAVAFFTVDTAAPETSLGGPEGTIRARSATFNPSSPDADQFECSLDRAPFDQCGSPTTRSGLGEGPHDFRARAIDAAGNVDPTPARRDFAVDRHVEGARLSAGRLQAFDGHLRIRLSARLRERGSVRLTTRLLVGAEGAVVAPPKRVQLGEAGSRSLTIEGSTAGDRRIRRALRNGTATVAVKGRFRDAVGNKRSDRVTIRLRGA
jgi:hypothetical protein